MSTTDDHPVPFGYEPATLMSDSLYGLICDTCGAVVARRSAEVHTQWHADLTTPDWAK